MSKILVIGSSNTDLIAKVDRFPLAGETVEGRFFLQAMGGKGANQALAAHRLGGDVKFVTCLGSDANGKNTLKYYQQEGLDVTSALIVKNAPTGTAMILVNNEGENCIVITPGANQELSAAYIENIEDEIATAYVVVLQMEIPMETVRKVCEIASRYHTQVLLNVAPAREVDAALLGMVNILVVNETEIEKISGMNIESDGTEAVMKNAGYESAIGEVRFRRGNVVLQFEVELVDQFIGGLAPQIGAHFVDDQLDSHGGMLAILCHCRFDPLSRVFQFHDVTPCGLYPSVPSNRCMSGTKSIPPFDLPDSAASIPAFRTGLASSVRPKETNARPNARWDATWVGSSSVATRRWSTASSKLPPSCRILLPSP